MLVIALFLGASFWVDGQGLGEHLTWYAAGQADARSILEGQWWRCVTALFLHADAGHLLANAAALAVLASMLCRRLGSGLVWGLFLFSGGLGNALNAWAQGPDHLSIGASTGVFGLIGVLGGGAGRAQAGKRAQALLLSLGFGLSFLALLGAGEERVDVGAHLFGLIVGLPVGLLLGGWHGVLGWKAWLSHLLGAAGFLGQSGPGFWPSETEKQPGGCFYGLEGMLTSSGQALRSGTGDGHRPDSNPLPFRRYARNRNCDTAR